MSPMWSLSLLVFLAVACSRKSVATTEFQEAMGEVRHELHTFTGAFPTEQAALDQIADANPAAAARQIETQIVPMLDRVCDRMQKAYDTGRTYLEAAGDEDPEAVATIRANVDRLPGMRAAYLRVRDLYAEEARLLRQGPLAASDETRLAQGVVDAVRTVTTN